MVRPRHAFELVAHSGYLARKSAFQPSVDESPPLKHWSKSDSVSTPARSGATVGSPAPALANACSTVGEMPSTLDCRPKTMVEMPDAFSACSSAATESGGQSTLPSPQ